jgi:hypothetical protein
MTARQRELARHALGLRPGRLVSYRNHFCCDAGHDDLAEWEAMVAAGFARKRTSAMLPPGDVMFHLTRAGAERALMPGDVLDPEDWP